MSEPVDEDRGPGVETHRQAVADCRLGAAAGERVDGRDLVRRRLDPGGERRPPAFDKTAYRGRNVVERCFARLKQFRAMATRFDKLAARYRAGVVIAALILWLRADS